MKTMQQQRQQLSSGATKGGPMASAAPRLATRRGAASIQRAPGAAAAAAAAAGRAARIAATLVPRSASTAVKDPVTDAAPAKAAEPKFDWAKAWYPAAAEEHLDPAKPHRVTLFGREIVLWRDAAATWRAQDDACPHRAAALSDGFVDTANSQIVCSYHGWRFDSEGRCVDIPQLNGDPKALATACGSARTCVKTYPVQAKGGLLWVWPDSSPGAVKESAAAAIPLPSELEDEALAPLEGRWFVREQPYSFDLFLENVLDPAHVDFAHDGVAGFAADKHKSIALELVEDRGPAGFTYRIIPSKPGVRPSILNFDAPSHVSILEEASAPPAAGAVAAADAKAVRPGAANPNVRSGLVFYVYPTRPGWSRFHGTSFVCDKDGKPVKSASIFSRGLPAWIQHTLGHTFLAGDDPHLHNGSKNLARNGWDYAQSYYPVAQDQAVLAMRRWLDTFAGGSPPWPAHMRGAAPLLANLDLEMPQILDRYSQHVRHCTHCSKALSNTQKVAARATALAFGLAAAAAAAALAKALAPVFAATAGATAVLQGGAAAAQLLPDWLSSCLGFFGPGNLLLLSAAAVVVAWAARGLERQFIFVPFDRKPFPASSGSPAAAGSA